MNSALELAFKDAMTETDPEKAVLAHRRYSRLMWAIGLEQALQEQELQNATAMAMDEAALEVTNDT